MCRWNAYFGKPVLLDELLFKTEHSLIDQSLHSRTEVLDQRRSLVRVLYRLERRDTCSPLPLVGVSALALGCGSRLCRSSVSRLRVRAAKALVSDELAMHATYGDAAFGAPANRKRAALALDADDPSASLLVFGATHHDVLAIDDPGTSPRVRKTGPAVFSDHCPRGRAPP